MCCVSRGCNITTKILAALKLVLPFYPICIHCCHPGDDSSCCEHLPLAAYRFPGRKIAAPALSEEQREQRALPLHAPQGHLRAEVSTTDHSQAPLKTCCRPSTSGLKKKKRHLPIALLYMGVSLPSLCSESEQHTQVQCI